MKKTPLSFLVALVLTILFSSCTENEGLKGDLQFGFDVTNELKSLDPGDANARVPMAVYITVNDMEGNVVLDFERLPLVKIANEYITKRVEFEEGSYTVEDFIVVDSNDSSIYITPKAGSELAHLVNEPLPLTFDIAPDATNGVVLEVVPVGHGSAAQFGYATFSFTLGHCLCNGLISYFPFNEYIADMAPDSSMFSIWDVGLGKDRYGRDMRAGYFNGHGARINLNNNQPLVVTDAFTIAAWVKMDSAGGGVNYSRNAIFQQRGDVASYSGSSMIVFLSENRYGNAEFSLRSSINDMAEYISVVAPAPEYGEWHHYAASLDGSNVMRLFLDGELVDKTKFEQEGNFVTSIDYVSIGVHIYKGLLNGSLNGFMDEFRIYDRALKQEEILRLCMK